MPDHKKREKKETTVAQQPDQAEATAGDARAGVQPADSQVEVYPAEELEGLKNDLEQARAKSAEYFEGWQRERADFSNYRRRIERDQAQTYQNLQGSIVKKFLPVVDDLSRALKNRPEGGEAASWANGIELIYRKLLSILESEGVHRMPAENEHFDPTRHEAISMEPSTDHQSGEIIEVIQDGYLIGDRVLRPALVRVAS